MHVYDIEISRPLIHVIHVLGFEISIPIMHVYGIEISRPTCITHVIHVLGFEISRPKTYNTHTGF